VTDEPSPHPGPRARPVAGLSLDGLLGRTDELARAWAVALILARRPSAFAEIPVEDLARDAPRLCAQVLRALDSDTELQRLTDTAPAGGRDPASASGLASMAGARDPGAVVSAVEALRGVLWEALLAELRGPALDRAGAHLLVDLADRLAYVCAMALSAALPAGLVRDTAIPGRGAVIVAERGDRPGPPREAPVAEDPQSWEQPAAPTGPAPVGAAPGEIEIRDERVEEGPAAWIRSIGRQLERFQHERRPFAVLLVELMDIERLVRSEPHDEVLRLAGQLERALEMELRTVSARTSGSLTREAPGRFWLISPGSDRSRAQALAEQIAHTARRSVSHRGQPLEVAIGTAVCPDDGLHAAALAAHADVALYSARAGGSAGGGAAG
jgi:GGDEF domain-containing protein